MRLFACLFLALLAGCPHTLIADDVRPGIVEISELAENSYVVRWSLPSGVGWSGQARLDFPDSCIEVGATARSRHYDCAHSLSAQSLGFEFIGLARPIHTVVRLKSLSGEEHTKVLSPNMRQWQVPARETFSAIVLDYLRYGFVHIFKGLDHLLFVLCLIWIAGGWRRIVWTITAFTIAHSITLGLSTLGLVRLAVPPVETVIALSVAFLASEVIRAEHNSLTWRYPGSIAAAFGLVHGLGFASVLSDIGVPQTHLFSALLSFNLGVEIGQVLFALPIALLLSLSRGKGWRTDFVRQWAGYGIGTLAAFWVMARLAALIP